MAVLVDEAGEEWEKQKKRNLRLNSGVPGVHAVVPIQCEICWIRNLEGCDLDRVKHCQYMECIRRANLDAINARASSTIEGHVRFIKKAVENAESINRTPFFKERGPFPLGDPIGNRHGIGSRFVAQVHILKRSNQSVDSISFNANGSLYFHSDLGFISCRHH